MKRAKLILAGIAVMAIAGGVFAAKAKRIGDVVYTRSTTTTNVCTVPLLTYTTAPNASFFTTTYVTTLQGAICTTHAIYSGE